VFKRLGKKQSRESPAILAIQRTQGGNDVNYGPNIPSEETSPFTKRVKHEERGKHYISFYSFVKYIYIFLK